MTNSPREVAPCEAHLLDQVSQRVSAEFAPQVEQAARALKDAEQNKAETERILRADPELEECRLLIHLPSLELQEYFRSLGGGDVALGHSRYMERWRQAEEPLMLANRKAAAAQDQLGHVQQLREIRTASAILAASERLGFQLAARHLTEEYGRLGAEAFASRLLQISAGARGAEEVELLLGALVARHGQE